MPASLVRCTKRRRHYSTLTAPAAESALTASAPASAPRARCPIAPHSLTINVGRNNISTTFLPWEVGSQRSSSFFIVGTQHFSTWAISGGHARPDCASPK
eukprot:3975187-Prymnesium_polylepis.1